MPKQLELTGQTFSKLIVLEYIGSSPKKQGSLWRCRCTCGNERIIHTGALRSGGAKSCKPCGTKVSNVAGKTHGKSNQPIFSAWTSMLMRCNNTRNQNYYNYGGRGITVCARWSSFENFYADMGDRPGKGYSLDRIDNNGDYEPGNCRWATQSQQGRNTRANHLLTIHGVTKCATEWSEESGIKANTILERLKRGWSVERAVFSPLRHRWGFVTK